MQEAHELTPQEPEEREIEAIEYPRIDRDKCTRCFKCVDACSYEALTMVSTMHSVDDLFEAVMKDVLFYESSGGGFTISGGEPLMHPDITCSLLKKAKENGLHTVLDTSGLAKWENFQRVMPYVDLVMFDIKSLDDEKHRKWTGVSNRLIHENLRKLAANFAGIRLRLPIIHSVNFWDLQYPRDIVAFAKPMEKSIQGIDLLPFHSFAAKKFGNLGRKGYFDNFPNIQKEELDDYQKIISQGGTWQTTVGGLIGVQDDGK